MVVATGTIESGRTLLFADRLMLLRVLPVLISLAARTEAEAETLFRRRVKLDRLLRLFKREPLVAGYKEVPFALASLLPDLSPFFRKLCVEKGVLLPVPSNMDAKEVSRVYDLLPQMPAIAKAHEELCLRFTAAMNKLTVMKHARVKSRSPQAKEMVQHGFSQAELQAVLQVCIDAGSLAVVLKVELIAYIKGVAAMMTAVEGDIAWVLREAIHADVQEFARVYVASLLKRVSSSNMDSPYARAVAADWAGIPEEEALEVVVKSRKGHPVNEDDLKRLALPRPTPPSLAQIHCLQHLVQALVIGASAGVKGGFFGPEKSKQGGKEEGGKSRSKGRDREVSASEIKELDNFLQRLLFFPHLLDYPSMHLKRDREVSASEIKELDNFLQRLLFFPHLLDYPSKLVAGSQVSMGFEVFQVKRDREVSASEIKELDNFLQRLLFFPHLLDYPSMEVSASEIKELDNFLQRLLFFPHLLDYPSMLFGIPRSFTQAGSCAVVTMVGAVGDTGVVDTLEARLENARRKHEANEYGDLPWAVVEAGIRSLWATEHPSRPASPRPVNTEGGVDMGVNAGGDQVGSSAGGMSSRQRGVIHADEVGGV
ncbi:unnamed protein product [Closterium sp. Yama58-4]|nr:unnamed protein product [Closterium sp. Yama58-4]